MHTLQSPYQAKIKLFSDGADRNQLLEMNNDPKIAGMTTNPSLMKKAGVKNYKEFCLEILTHIKQKPISFEVFADDIGEMHRQALEIAKWGQNVYVKIPVMNTKCESTAKLVHELSHAKVKLNVTAVFTIPQAFEVAQALKGGAPSILSVFAGRIADSGRDPMPLMRGCAEICQATDKNIELLWASTREVYNVVQAEESGCQIITAPADVLKKVSGFNKEPFALSLDTIKTFKSDSEAAGFQL